MHKRWRQLVIDKASSVLLKQMGHSGIEIVIVLLSSSIRSYGHQVSKSQDHQEEEARLLSSFIFTT